MEHSIISEHTLENRPDRSIFNCGILRFNTGKMPALPGPLQPFDFKFRDHRTFFKYFLRLSGKISIFSQTQKTGSPDTFQPARITESISRFLETPIGTIYFYITIVTYNEFNMRRSHQKLQAKEPRVIRRKILNTYEMNVCARSEWNMHGQGGRISGCVSGTPCV